MARPGKTATSIAEPEAAVVIASSWLAQASFGTTKEAQRWLGTKLVQGVASRLQAKSPNRLSQWFTELWTKLSDVYGPCRIYLDGASYHKRRVNPMPTGANRKQVLQNWLVSKGIAFDTPIRKVQFFFSLVRQNKEIHHYAICDIAMKFGYTVIYTPLIILNCSRSR